MSINVVIEDLVLNVSIQNLTWEAGLQAIRALGKGVLVSLTTQGNGFALRLTDVKWTDLERAMYSLNKVVPSGPVTLKPVTPDTIEYR